MKIILNCQDRIFTAVWQALPRGAKARELERFFRLFLCRGGVDDVLVSITDAEARKKIKALLEQEGFLSAPAPSNRNNYLTGQAEQQKERKVEDKRQGSEQKKEVHFEWMDEMYEKLNRMMAGK